MRVNLIFSRYEYFKKFAFNTYFIKNEVWTKITAVVLINDFINYVNTRNIHED